MHWTTARSLEATAVVNSRPIPGQANTVSVTTAQPRSSPTFRPRIVTTGMARVGERVGDDAADRVRPASSARSACTSSTGHRSSTSGCSGRSVRRTRCRGSAPASPGATLSPIPTTATSAAAARTAGSRGMPRKKFGMEKPNTAKPITDRSDPAVAVDRAASTPSGNPTSSAIRIETPPSSAVFGTRSHTSAKASWSLRNEMPKSPRSNARP